MGHIQPATPIEMKNTAARGIITKTLTLKRPKANETSVSIDYEVGITKINSICIGSQEVRIFPIIMQIIILQNIIAKYEASVWRKMPSLYKIKKNQVSREGVLI